MLPNGSQPRPAALAYGPEYEETLLRRKGDALFDEGKHDEARQFYWMVVKIILGPDLRVPTLLGPDGSIFDEKYKTMGHLIVAQLSGCFAGLVRCCLREKDIESAIMWLEEMEAMYRNSYFHAEKPLCDYIFYNIDIPEITYQRIVVLTSISEAVMRELGNTSAAFWWRWRALTHFSELSAKHHTPAVKKLTSLGPMQELMFLRHPDPNLYAKFGLKNERMQISGSWKRIRYKQTRGCIMKRSGFASFIWNSCLYVAGGREYAVGPYFRDLWCLDLKHPTTWRRLPDYPTPLPVSNIFFGWIFLLDRQAKRAYLFNGRSEVDYFDLATEQWGRLKTSYTPTAEDRAAGVVGNWPYRGQQACDYAAQIVDQKILIFGGCHRDTEMGCNLFMELNLHTRVWRRLSGTVIPPEHGDYSCPGPRKYAGSWIGKNKDKFCLLYGNFDRHMFNSETEFHRSSLGYTQTDFWAWNLKKEKWSRERVCGNAPCPRTEFGVTYNPKLDKVFVFGGYNYGFTTIVPDSVPPLEFDFAYFADTFMLDCEDNPSVPLVARAQPPPIASSVVWQKWRQVLTPGFPTYRCHAALNTDHDTGKMYLFGGFTNDDWVSAGGDFKSTSFGDLYQLKVNLPGGYFEGVDIEEEWKTARAGPWRRCFTCGSAGIGKKCGGSCKGRAHFCDAECLAEGWKQHKAMHKCQKL